MTGNIFNERVTVKCPACNATQVAYRDRIGKNVICTNCPATFVLEPAAVEGHRAASRTASDYQIPDALRIVCLVGACLAPAVGIAAAEVSGNGYYVLLGILSAVPLAFMAACLRLAIDIAGHTKQAAGELKELRVLLAKQVETPAKAESAKE